MKLIDFSYNTYSQFGEDGIIEKIFSIIGTTSKKCVEFGAWDGIYLSNTAHLWKDQDWSAILIESDISRISELKHKNILAINAMVGFNNEKDSIDYILQSNNIKDVIDFMSIDIDGNDYYIVESLQSQPRVLCIEYNPTIPFWIDCYQQKDKSFGASLAAVTRVAKEKGYYLVSVTDTNAIFVLDIYKDLFINFNTNYSDIACYTHYISMITNYHGEYKIVGTPPYKIKELIANDHIIFKE